MPCSASESAYQAALFSVVAMIWKKAIAITSAWGINKNFQRIHKKVTIFDLDEGRVVRQRTRKL